MHHVGAVLIARVGRLDEQHRFDGRFLIRRLFEFGEALLQQTLEVQRDPEKGAGRNVMQGTAHAFSWQSHGAAPDFVNVLTVIIKMLTIVKRGTLSSRWLRWAIRCRMSTTAIKTKTSSVR
jgi:hypothetical protein